MFEQVVEGTSFEIEIIRRLEGIPSEKGQVFEERVARLPDEYSSAFDLLRQHKHVPMYREPLQGELTRYMQGLSDWPLIQTFADMLGMDMDKVDEIGDDISDWMLRAAPNVTRILLGAIPGASGVADIIGDAVQAMVDQERDRKPQRSMAGLPEVSKQNAMKLKL